MAWNRLTKAVAAALVVYLCLVGLGAAALLINSFPTLVETEWDFPTCSFTTDGSPERGLLLLALLAGVLGSFLHAAQSLASYIGNRSLRPSWAAWYVLRPWIGGFLGLAAHLVVLAGFAGPAGGASPYGTVALGVLAGWFSKTTTDKLQEVFETLLKTDADSKRKDKLAATVPIIEKVTPNPAAAGTNALQVVGKGFLEGARVSLDSVEASAKLESPTLISVDLAQLKSRPSGEVTLRVVNPAPEGEAAGSAEQTITFEP